MRLRLFFALLAIAVALLLAALSCRPDEPSRAPPRVTETVAPDAAGPAASPPRRERVRVPPAAEAPPSTDPDATSGTATEPLPLPGKEGTVPDDVKDVGDAALLLRLVDAVTMQPVGGVGVELWRLGAPAVGDWGAGDHIHGTVQVPLSGVRIEGLPPGRYRARCDFQRHDSEDPEAFAVSSGENELALRVTATRALPIRVLLFDPSGGRITAAWMEERGPYSSGTNSPRAPEWADVRRHASRTWELEFGGSGGAAGAIVRRDMRDDGDGFDLGTLEEATRTLSRRRQIRLTPANGSSVQCNLHGREVRERAVYVGVSVPLAELLSQVTMPNGTPALDAAAEVRAEGAATLADSADAQDAWREATISVGVRLAGHADLQFEWRVGDPWPVHRLVALAE